MKRALQVLAIVFAIAAGHVTRPSLESELNSLMGQGYRIFDPQGFEIDRFEAIDYPPMAGIVK